MKSKLKLVLGLCLVTFATQTFAMVIGGSNYLVQTFYENPHAGETLVAFDWGDNNNLYYSTGRPDWGLGLSIYRYDGATALKLYTDENAFAGSRVTVIGGRIYFNDGGTYDRWTCDYYRYDPVHPSAPVNIGVLSDISGLETRTGTDFWAAGGWNAAIYYSTLNADGDLLSNPLVNLGTIGNASGPIVFDKDGNLYYVEGYVAEGKPTVYRWSAAEVAAAIADPAGNPLSPDGHTWASLSSGDGASGMVVDNKGHLVVTATSFTDPSQLQRLFVTNGIYAGYEVLARSDERLESVRLRAGRIYVSSSAGICAVLPMQADTHVINDYDYDGKSDLAVYRAGYWSIYSLENGIILNNVGVWGESDSIAVPGDYDGDGKADLAVYRAGYWSVYSLTNGIILDNAGIWGEANSIPVPGDYDGDGKSDLALYRDGIWSIYMMGSGETLSGPFGEAGCTPVPGDYDGDGKADLALYRDGIWSIYMMGSGDILSGPFGEAGCTPVPGDYDGDGKSDLALYRDGIWSIYMMGSGETLSGPFGEAGCTPVPGDYDGDGKSDLALYRDGYWAIRSLKSGVILDAAGEWGGPDSVPVK